MDRIEGKGGTEVSGISRKKKIAENEEVLYLIVLNRKSGGKRSNAKQKNKKLNFK